LDQVIWWNRLQVYRQSLGEVPLGLLELAVRRTLRVIV